MSPGEFSLIAAKPPGWPLLLFARALQREIRGATQLRRRWHTCLVNEPPAMFDRTAYGAHIERCCSEARRIRTGLQTHWDAVLRYAGSPPEDPLAVVETARLIGEQYRALLEWKPACLSLFVPAQLAVRRDEFSRMCDETILRLEVIVHGHSDRTLAAMLQSPASHESLRLPELDFSGPERITAALTRQ